MAEKCEKCSGSMTVLEDTDDYRLSVCERCHRFRLEVAEHLLRDDVTFHVAAKEPWPEGGWVRIVYGGAAEEDAEFEEVADLA